MAPATASAAVIQSRNGAEPEHIMRGDWTDLFSGRARAIQPSAIRAMAKYLAEPGVISFAGGAPDPQFFPADEVAAAAGAILADPKRRQQALQYGPSEGYLPLREFLARELSAKHAQTSFDEIIITSGSQQALEFVGKTFLDAGDRIVVANPTYVGALQAFSLFAPEIASVSASPSAIDISALENALKQGAKFLYLMPDYGNPTGQSLSMEDRLAVLDLAARYRTPLIEDQAYEQLQISGEPMPSLLRLAKSHPQRPDVLYLGTFSKSLMPGLRVGWIAAPTQVISKLVAIKQASDLNSGCLNQMIVHDVAQKIFDTRGETLTQAYRLKRDAMLDALSGYMPRGIEWTRPAGGMFVWLTLPAEIDATAIQMQVFEQSKVLYVPGASFHANGGGENTIRLSYSLNDPAQIEDGIRRLSNALSMVVSSDAALV
ncbi:aminotransferase-like domain-containing protein [Mesorhizobium sp. A623]